MRILQIGKWLYKCYNVSTYTKNWFYRTTPSSIVKFFIYPLVLYLFISITLYDYYYNWLLSNVYNFLYNYICILSLYINPFLIQDRVRLEINSIYKQYGEKLTMSSLQQLLYLNRCLKETMRLYPIAPFIGRLTTEDVKLRAYNK